MTDPTAVAREIIALNLWPHLPEYIPREDIATAELILGKAIEMCLTRARQEGEEAMRDRAAAYFEAMADEADADGNRWAAHRRTIASAIRLVPLSAQPEEAL